MSRKPYVRPISKTWWWLKHPRYMRYMSREVTCIFIGAFALLMVCTLERLSHGQAAYEAFFCRHYRPMECIGLDRCFGVSRAQRDQLVQRHPQCLAGADR